MEPKPRRGYWYLTTIEYCPVCGSEAKYRERQYTEKPEDWEDRNIMHTRYDWCDAL